MYSYMDDWQRLNETSLLDKKEFYKNLTMINITEAEYKHANRAWNDFRIQNWDEYHDLYVQSDTLLSDNVFESFRRKCLEIY